MSHSSENDNTTVKFADDHLNSPHFIDSLLFTLNQSTLNQSIDNTIDNTIDSSLVDKIYSVIFVTPNFKKQVALIDRILSESPKPFHRNLLNSVILNFKNIPSDRKDKFFYLIKKTLNLMPFEYILKIEDKEVQCYIWKNVITEKLADWDDRMFIEFVMKSEAYLVGCIGKFKIEKTLVEEYLEKDMGVKQREYLYSLLK